MSAHTTHGINRPADEPSPAMVVHGKHTHRLVAWGTGLLVVGAFFGVLHLAEREVDINSRMAQINAELDAADERLQRAAHALCQAEAGPGAKVLWTSDGDLVCRPAVITAGVSK